MSKRFVVGGGTFKLPVLSYKKSYNNNDNDNDNDKDNDNDNTVEPLLSGHPLSGQLLKSRNYCQYNTVNKTPFKRPPLLSDRGHFSAVPMSVLLLFLPQFSGQ